MYEEKTQNFITKLFIQERKNCEITKTTTEQTMYANIKSFEIIIIINCVEWN